MRRYELREDQWQKIAPLLPGKETDPGRTADNRLFVHAVLWIARSGRHPAVPLGGTCPNVLVSGIVFINALTAGPRKEFGIGYLKNYKNLIWNGS